VLSVSTTTLILQVPFADHGLINVGGAVFKRSDLRLHLFRALDYTRHTVEIDGSIGNVTDLQEALPVNIANSPSVTMTSTTMSGGQTAHDTAITGAPMRVGAVARTALTPVSATGDAVDMPATMYGVPIQKLYSIPELDWQFACTAPIAVATDVVAKAAAAAGLRNYVTNLQYSNASATATEIVIKDGATVIWRGFAPANMGGMQDITFTTPLRGTAATAVNFQCITAAASVYINTQGYVAP
jgi:hypothetical protein